MSEFRWRISIGYDSVYSPDDDKDTTIIVRYLSKSRYTWSVIEWPDGASEPRTVHQSEEIYTDKRRAQRAAEAWFVALRRDAPDAQR